MKVLIFKSMLILCWLSISLPALQSAEAPHPSPAELLKKEFSKTIKKEFPIGSNGEVVLSNKFGEIKVNSWNENKVKVNVTIIVNASSESDAEKTFGRIKIDFANSSSKVSAETQIESSSSNWSWWGSSSSNDFEIKYEVMMPRSAALNLSMAHGDTFVDELSGDAALNIKHGSFRMESLGGDLHVDLAHGNGTVTKARNVRLDIRHSTLHLKEAMKVDLDTRHSNIEIDKATDVKADGGHDNYDLGNLSNFDYDGQHDNIDIKSVEIINANSRYTEIDINRLGKHGHFDLAFGGVDIALLSNSFAELDFSGSHSDLKVRVEPGAAYQLDMQGEHSSMNYPDGMKVTMEKDQGSDMEVKGHMGNASAKSTIKVRLEHGEARIR